MKGNQEGKIQKGNALKKANAALSQPTPKYQLLLNHYNENLLFTLILFGKSSFLVLAQRRIFS